MSDNVADLRESLRGVGMTLTRIEKVMRDKLEIDRSICEHAAFIAQAIEPLPQLAKDLRALIEVLVPAANLVAVVGGKP